MHYPGVSRKIKAPALEMGWGGFLVNLKRVALEVGSLGVRGRFSTLGETRRASGLGLGCKG